jgi:predicted NAD/FAD-binding protein
MSMRDIGQFPAVTLLRFFDNHCLLGINTHPQWKVIRGGSSSYIAPLTAPYRDRILTGADRLRIARDAVGVTVESPAFSALRFDEVVFACPAAEALTSLKQPTTAETAILPAFRTAPNDAILHSDSRLLPSRAHARASWNYRLSSDSEVHPTVTYHMNRLQNLRLAEDYCVSLNERRPIDSMKTIRRMMYHHPLYTPAAVRAQGEWSRISGHNRTHYCGAYWFYGFHEDGLNSGMRVARALGIAC